MIVWASVAVVWLGSIWLGGFVAREKDRDPTLGYMLGLFFGLFGVLVLSLLPPGQGHVSPCRETIEESEPEPDWDALGIKAPPQEAPPTFMLPPARFRGLRDEQADSL